MRHQHIWFFIGLVGLISMACNLPNLFATPTEEAIVGIDQTELADPQLSGASPLMQETPTYTTDPLSFARACLSGNWMMNNLGSYVSAAIPQELVEEYNLVYKDTNGTAILSLTSQGQIMLRFDGLIFRFDASVSFFTAPLTVGIDGEARGEYSLSEDTLTTSQMDTSSLTAVAQAMGQDVVDPAQIISLIPLVQPPFNRAAYTCNGDVLQLKFPAYPDDFPPLVFQRVN